MTPDHREGGKVARRLLRAHLRPALSLARRGERLLRRQIAHLETIDQPWAEAQAILVSRVADDLLAVRSLVSQGYYLQGMTLGASVFELAYTASFIGTNARRAHRWLHWDRREEAPWRLLRMVHDVWLAIGIPDTPETDPCYQILCCGKHGSPLMQRAVGAVATPEAHALNVDPLLGDRAQYGGEATVWLTVKPVVMYLLLSDEAKTLGPDAAGEFKKFGRMWLSFETDVRGRLRA